MTVRVDIPIRVEVGAELVRADASRELAAQVAEAVSQNLAFMTAELAAGVHHGPAAFAEPKMRWTGPGVDARSARDRAQTEARLRDAVRTAGQRFAAASRSARLAPSGGAAGALSFVPQAVVMPVTYGLLTPRARFTLDSGSWEPRGHGGVGTDRSGATRRHDRARLITRSPK